MTESGSGGRGERGVNGLNFAGIQSATMHTVTTIRRPSYSFAQISSTRPLTSVILRQAEAPRVRPRMKSVRLKGELIAKS
jgi:hypothetical protein